MSQLNYLVIRKMRLTIEKSICNVEEAARQATFAITSDEVPHSSVQNDMIGQRNNVTHLDSHSQGQVGKGQFGKHRFFVLALPEVLKLIDGDQERIAIPQL